MQILQDILKLLEKCSEVLMLGVPKQEYLTPLIASELKMTIIDSSDDNLKGVTIGNNMVFEKKNMDFLLLPPRKYNGVIALDYKYNVAVLRELSKALQNKGVLFVTADVYKNYVPFETKLKANAYKPNEILRYVIDLHRFNILHYSEMGDKTQLLAMSTL